MPPEMRFPVSVILGILTAIVVSGSISYQCANGGCYLEGAAVRDGTVRDIVATYGASCGVRTGNATSDVKRECTGRQSCSYVVDVFKLGDPIDGCPKDFIVEWRCDSDGPTYRFEVPPEAGLGGRVATLSCEVDATGGVRGLSGANAGSE